MFTNLFPNLPVTYYTYCAIFIDRIFIIENKKIMNVLDTNVPTILDKISNNKHLLSQKV